MGEYTKDIDNMTFSFSRCHSFEGCKYEWYMNYLLKDDDGKPIYESEQNFYAAFGKLCHEILEKFLLGEINLDEALDCFCESYDLQVRLLCENDTTCEKYFAYGYDYFSNVDFGWLKDYEILGIEKECRFEVSGIPFVGYIDLLIKDKTTGEIIVIDHKSSDYPIGKKGGILKRKQEDYEAYKRQLYLYSHQIYNEYNVYPSKLVWNYFKEQKWLELPFIYEEFVEANKWVERTVAKIKEEDEFIPKLDYFYCHNLCGFRNACDYLMLED